MDDQYSEGKTFPTLVIKIMCSATAYYVPQERNARTLQHESKDAWIVHHEVSHCVRSRLNLVKELQKTNRTVGCTASVLSIVATSRGHGGQHC